MRVIDLGAATIAGVTTTHYHTVTMERTTDSKAQTAREVIDLWTDRQRRLVKMVIATKLAGQTSTATETFSDYGGPAPIHAPPADEVYSFGSAVQSTTDTVQTHPPSRIP